MRRLLGMAGRRAANPRVAVPLLMFGCVMLLFAAQRAAVMAGHVERLEDVTRGEVARSFATGLRFDALAAATLTLPFTVLMSVAAPSWLTRRWFRWATAALASTVLAVACFAGLADFYFFREFDERLNHKALNYLDQAYTYKVIWDSYPVIPVMLATLFVLTGGAWAFGRATFRRDFNDFHFIGRVLWPAVQGVVIAILIRGTLGPKALNAGPAYFSDSPTLAQLTLNPLYTLREAALSATYRSEDLDDSLTLLPEQEALELAARMIVRPGDRPSGDGRNPLRRVTDTGKPREDYNVVLVVLESLSWHYVGAMGGDARLTPNFSKLCDAGVLMERCFAVGDRTTRGFSGIVAGFPDLPGRSVTIRIEAEGEFLTVGHVLRHRGYETMFVYAGQPMYDHRQSFLRSNGYEKLVFEKEFDSHTFRTDLGWCDEDLFSESLRQFDAMGDRPFLATLLTLSFHRPYLIPPNRIHPVDPNHRNRKQLDSVRYTDWAIGRFMDEVRTKPYFDRTLFVFVADHSGGFAEHPVDTADFRVPFLLYGPKILGGAKRVDTVCSQTDVIPTVMSVLGGSYEHCFFGSNVLDRPRGAGLALVQRPSDALSMVDHNGDVVVIPFGGQAKLARFEMPDAVVPATDASPGRIAELSRRAIALLQTANTVFERGVHFVPDYERDDDDDASSTSKAGVAAR